MNPTTCKLVRLEKILKYASMFKTVKVEESFFDEESGKWKAGYFIVDEALSLIKLQLPYHTSLDMKDDKYLFVIDIDSKHVSVGWEIVQTIVKYTHQKFFIKHSGNKGFHMECVLDKADLNKVSDRGFTNIQQYAKSVILDICLGINNTSQVHTTISQPEATRKDITYLDVSLHNNNHLIRGLYSYHPKSKRYSIPVELDWTVEQIFHRSRSKNLQETYEIDSTLPKFDMFHLGISTNFIYEDSMRETATELEFDEVVINVEDESVALIVDTLKTDAPPCLQQVLVKSGDVGHALRFHTTLFIKTQGFSISQILSFWK